MFAVRYGSGRVASLLEERERPGQRPQERLGPRPAPGRAATVGGLCAALLFALSAGSSLADRYLPRNDGSVARLAYVAQMVRQPDGTCPDFSRGRCAPDPRALLAADPSRTNFR